MPWHADQDHALRIPPQPSELPYEKKENHDGWRTICAARPCIARLGTATFPIEAYVLQTRRASAWLNKWKINGMLTKITHSEYHRNLRDPYEKLSSKCLASPAGQLQSSVCLDCKSCSPQLGNLMHGRAAQMVRHPSWFLMTMTRLSY